MTASTEVRTHSHVMVVQDAGGTQEHRRGWDGKPNSTHAT